MGGWQIYDQLADPECPAEVLISYASHEDSSYRQQVVRHPDCPIEALHILAQRPLLALPSLPLGVAATIAQDHHIINLGVASHPNCPLDLLLTLVESDYETVRQAAYTNPNMPAHLRVIGTLR